MLYSRRVAGRGWLRSLSAVCALALPAAASANAGVFFGAGGQVTPIRNEDVRLVKERVSIRPRIDGRPGKWGAPFFIRADVEAEFLLANTADRPVELQVGFPLVGELDHSILDFHAREGGSERPVATKRGLVELKRDRDRTFETVVAWNETFGSRAPRPTPRP